MDSTELMLNELGQHGLFFGPFFLLYENGVPIVKFELHPVTGGLSLAYIEALTRGRGDGQRALKLLCDLADKHSVTMWLQIKAMKDKSRRTPKKVLSEIYARFGFVKSTKHWTGADYRMRNPSAHSA